MDHNKNLFLKVRAHAYPRSLGQCDVYYDILIRPEDIKSVVSEEENECTINLYEGGSIHTAESLDAIFEKINSCNQTEES